MALEIVVHLFERTSRWLRVGMRARDDGQALSHEIFGDVGGVFLGRHRDGRGAATATAWSTPSSHVTHRRAPGVFIVSRMNFKHRGASSTVESTHFGLLHGNV